MSPDIISCINSLWRRFVTLSPEPWVVGGAEGEEGFIGEVEVSEDIIAFVFGGWGDKDTGEKVVGKGECSS